MPKKIRELKALLQQFSYVRRAGKGSHTVWEHSTLPNIVVLSGKDGADAKPYQEREVKDAVQAAKEQNK
jgi:predicted RNA binding protein YcfA (HicA-like mRNA interferase family)